MARHKVPLGRRPVGELCAVAGDGANKHGFVGDAWTARHLVAAVRKTFGAECGVRGMQPPLHRIRFTGKAPLPRHPTAADWELAWLKRMVAGIRGSRKGWVVYMIDLASLIWGSAHAVVVADSPA